MRRHQPGALVDEPACATDGPLLDPGFELAAVDLSPGWALSGSASDENATRRVLLDEATARTGSGALELAVGRHCRVVYASTWAVVPPPDNTAGPAFTFWHNVPDYEESLAAVEVVQETFLPRGGGWTEGVICLDPALAGRQVQIEFSFKDYYVLCSDSPYELLSAYFDDVAMTTHASCPNE